MPHSNCPGCIYDEQRKIERAELRRQRRLLADQPRQQNGAQMAPASPSSIPDLEESEVEDSEEEDDEGDWETDEEQGDEFQDMVEAIVSHAFAYKAMRDPVATDKERKHAAKVLAALRAEGVAEGISADIPSSAKERQGGGSEKRKRIKGKGKQGDFGTSSARWRAQGMRSGKKGQSNSKPLGSGSGRGVTPPANGKMTPPIIKHAFDETD